MKILNWIACIYWVITIILMCFGHEPYFGTIIVACFISAMHFFDNAIK